MGTRPQELTIFFAHQFSSSVENSTDIRTAVRTASNRCQSAWNRFYTRNQLRLNYTSIPKIPAEADADIFTHVLRSIRESDICIFSLTDSNLNVVFELGYAHGRDKENIWIINERIPFDSLPSDFRNRYILVYSNKDDLEDKLEREIQERVKKRLGLETPEHYFSEFWNLDGQKRAEIVAPCLPQADLPRYANSSNANYLKYSSFADVDAVVHSIKFLQRAFDIDSDEYTNVTWQKAIDAPTFFLGGPIWNAAARRFYRFPGDSVVGNKLPTYFAAQADADYDLIMHNGTELKPQTYDGVGVDEYALFGRLLDSENGLPIFVAAGNRTHGTLAALQAFDNTAFGKRNCEAVLKAVDHHPQFVAVFKCRIWNGIPSTPNLTEPSLIVSIDKIG